MMSDMLRKIIIHFGVGFSPHKHGINPSMCYISKCGNKKKKKQSFSHHPPSPWMAFPLSCAVSLSASIELGLVGGWWLGHPSEKYDWKSIGMMKATQPNMNGKIKLMATKPPTSHLFSPLSFLRLSRNEPCLFLFKLIDWTPNVHAQCSQNSCFPETRLFIVQFTLFITFYGYVGILQDPLLSLYTDWSIRIASSCIAIIPNILGSKSPSKYQLINRLLADTFPNM